MNLDRTEFHYHYTLGPEWLDQLIIGLGASVEDNKLIKLPKNIAAGSAMFLQVIPGLSVLLMDMTFHLPVAMCRSAKEENMYMAYYDMGQEITTHLLYGQAHRVGYNSSLGLAFMDGNIPGTIMPPVGERSYSLRLLIDKTFLKKIAGPNQTEEINAKLFDGSKNTLFFYSHIDSRSKVLLNRLNCYSSENISFEYHLKSTALQLLAYLVERAARFEPIINKLSEHDLKAVSLTADYLLKNLLSEFPGLGQLAEMAGMSLSKYKVLFKKIFKETPNTFFQNEKLLLGRELLVSGNYKTVTEVAYDLGYSKPSYFAELFKKMFFISPKDVLIKSNQ